MSAREKFETWQKEQDGGPDWNNFEEYVNDMKEGLAERRKIETMLAKPSPDRTELMNEYISKKVGIEVVGLDMAKQEFSVAAEQHRVAEEQFNCLGWFKRNFSSAEHEKLNAAVDRIEAAETRLEQAREYLSQAKEEFKPEAEVAANQECALDHERRRELEEGLKYLPTAEAVQELVQELEEDKTLQNQAAEQEEELEM
jgi:hypothetical protein